MAHFPRLARYEGTIFYPEAVQELPGYPPDDSSSDHEHEGGTPVSAPTSSADQGPEVFPSVSRPWTAADQTHGVVTSAIPQQQQHEDEPPLWQRQQQHEQREAASAAALQAMVAEEVIMRSEARAPSYDYTQMYPLWYRTAYEQGPPVPSPVAWQEALMMYDQQPVEVASAPGF